MTSRENEHDRIAGVYAGMSDDELRQVAQSGDELSEIAAAALKAEAARRGLDLSVTPPSGFDVPELNETVTLRQYRDLPDALLAKGSLESAGIQAYLADDNLIRLGWF